MGIHIPHIGRIELLHEVNVALPQKLAAQASQPTPPAGDRSAETAEAALLTVTVRLAA